MGTKRSRYPREVRKTFSNPVILRGAIEQPSFSKKTVSPHGPSLRSLRIRQLPSISNPSKFSR